MNCIDLIVATPNEHLMPEYFALLLNSAFGKRAFASGSTGTAQQHFNVGAFRTLSIPLPPREMQEALVSDTRSLQRAGDAVLLRARNASVVMHEILRDGTQ
jgi:type I restriction enzyme S subunit